MKELAGASGVPSSIERAIRLWSRWWWDRALRGQPGWFSFFSSSSLERRATAAADTLLLVGAFRRSRCRKRGRGEVHEKFRLKFSVSGGSES